MTNEDRIGLLKAVAERAPEGMGAVFCERDLDDPTETDFVGFTGLTQVTTTDRGTRHGDCPSLDLTGNTREGWACFAMLDAMEGAGFEITTGINEDDESPTVGQRIVRYRRLTGRCVCCQSLQIIFGAGCGTTRAEAIARAFVAAFTHPPESS